MVFLSKTKYFISHNFGIFLYYISILKIFLYYKSNSKITYNNTSSRNKRGKGVLLSRATATREAMQYRRNQAHLCVSAQQGRVSSSKSQARATSTCSHQTLKRTVSLGNALILCFATATIPGFMGMLVQKLLLLHQ